MTYPLYKPQNPKLPLSTVVCTETDGVAAGLAVAADGKIATTSGSAVGINMFDCEPAGTLSVAGTGSKVTVMAGAAFNAAEAKAGLKVSTGGKIIKISNGEEALIFATGEEAAGQDGDYVTVVLK